ncbi:MAG: type II toxin-antitoxin system VapB family antitoxin [Propionicimonas sp.]|uniref:type II toxin-antitoxin system VapB family antitoxin n=1 Tax=Propionicimonas sp. TaxID=1955623 RepID=UPI003D0EE3A6
MSLNIKNEDIHARVRRLAELTGLSQTGAVDDAVQHRLAELEGTPARRKVRIDAVVRAIQVDLSDVERQALRDTDRDLYAADGLPR